MNDLICFTECYKYMSLFSGAYEYQFTQPGTYYYWSGAVDQYESIFLRGVVTVKDSVSTVQPLSLTINDIEAIYNIGGQTCA